MKGSSAEEKHTYWWVQIVVAVVSAAGAIGAAYLISHKREPIQIVAPTPTAQPERALLENRQVAAALVDERDDDCRSFSQDLVSIADAKTIEDIFKAEQQLAVEFLDIERVDKELSPWFPSENHRDNSIYDAYSASIGDDHGIRTGNVEQQQDLKRWAAVVQTNCNKKVERLKKRLGFTALPLPSPITRPPG